jgi:hypothetical protein
VPHTGSVGVRGSSPLSSTLSEQGKRTVPLSIEDGADFFVHRCEHPQAPEGVTLLRVKMPFLRPQSGSDLRKRP